MAGFPAGGLRHSILDLAPLELDCMNALWPLGRATVRDIQQALAPTRPRAYTTIMTILDRLTQKGVVLREKSGRAWVYRPNLSADQARSQALAQFVNGFFSGSNEALATHLSVQGWPSPAPGVPAAGLPQPPAPRPHSRVRRKEVESPAQAEESPAAPLDTSLL
jgi:predicted transcriptional regulator